MKLHLRIKPLASYRDVTAAPHGEFPLRAPESGCAIQSAIGTYRPGQLHAILMDGSRVVVAYRDVEQVTDC